MSDCFKCLICGRVCDDLTQLSDHITNHHVREEQDLASVTNFLAALQQVNSKRDLKETQMKIAAPGDDVHLSDVGAAADVSMEALITCSDECSSDTLQKDLQVSSALCAKSDKRLSGTVRKKTVGGSCRRPSKRSRCNRNDVDVENAGLNQNEMGETLVDQYRDSLDRVGCEGSSEKHTQEYAVRKENKVTSEGRLEESIGCHDLGTSHKISRLKESDRLYCPTCEVVFAGVDDFKGHRCTGTSVSKVRSSLRIKQRNVRRQAIKRQLSPGDVESRGRSDITTAPEQENGGLSQTTQHDGPCFVCKICEKMFKCKVRLRQHESGHGSSSLQCELCEKQFLRKNLLTSHMKTAHARQRKPQPFPCDQCEHVAYSRNGLKRHQALRHFDGRTFKCTYEKCESAFGLKDDLVRHVAAVHESSKHKYKCEFCSRTFLHKTKFDTHRYSHDKTLSPHVCKECNRGFSTGDALEGHILTIHENKRPFKCEHCDKAYTKKYALDQHMRKHTGEKISKCSICEEMFVNASERRHHMKNEHGVGHPCSDCGALFISEYKCKQHAVKQHTNQKQLLCNLCKKSVATTAELQEHLTTFHRIENSSLTETEQGDAGAPAVGANTEIDYHEDSVLAAEPDKINDSNNIQIIETPVIAMQHGGDGNGDHVIFVESSELEAPLHAESKTMIVYFCPTDNSESIASQDGSELETPQDVPLTENDLQENSESIVM